ncbi:gamma-glutamyltransferase [Polyangium sorediatum]|uniref:Glutathione hydrolase proenzyme n=1 Tax=Polyangium sorediatum TaxID=889274 RepID=A0ABT6NU62_9BACT|nr:gamma-glutamyltransferase [Polyangium sorediatum]MDI1431868.1 gamma-glutamyltransferase [Polyangium sorediatum]
MPARPRLFLLAAALVSACVAQTPAPRDDAAPPPPAATAAAPTASTTAPVAVVPATSASASAPAPAPDPYPAPPPPDPPVALRPGGKRAVQGEAGLVTSVEKNATRIGATVLRRGGNAVDAAVAVAYALAVTHPSAGNIGGGGVMMIRLKSGETHFVDFRETAPAAGATTEKVLAMLDHDGGIGLRSAGVPGTVAGLSLALERFGTRPLAELLAPAIELAKKGHALGPRQALTLAWAWNKLEHDPAARAIWGKGKKPLAEGERVRQPDLARTLESIAKEGPRAFYEGFFARTIDEWMKKGGGYVTAKDMADYRAKLRAPLRFSYRGFSVETAPPPSMGGVAFAQIMLSLERARAYEQKPGSADALHLFVEAARRAYADRRLVAADPDFGPKDLDTKLQALLSGAHLVTRKPAIDPARATPSATLAAAMPEAVQESPETTHFSIVDAEGNAVACTYTLSAGFGAKVVVPGTGVLLGNALGGFSKDGPNVVAPGKRMATSMSPTLVTQGGRLALVLGSPGGDTIPNTVAQVFRNLVDWGMTIDEAITSGRLHHQFQPDKLRVEKQRPPSREVLAELARRGHTIEQSNLTQGDANDILVDPQTGTAYGFADPREGGTAEGVSRAEVEKAKSARP